MKILIMLIVLLSSIWIPALFEQYYHLASWLSIVITLSFISIYLLAFFTLLSLIKSASEN